MKKRVLKKWVNDSLSLLTLILAITLCCIDDFTAVGLLVMIVMIAVIAINLNILEKYGRSIKE